MFKAVIFDWDGTLADTKKAVVESFRRVLAEVGCVVDGEFIERRIGIGTRKILEEVLREGNITFDDRMLEELTREKVKIQTELSEVVNLFEGAIDLLDALYGRIKMALATMSGRKVIDRLLSEKKIEKYFDVVVTADEVSKPKPDPEVFLLSATKLNLSPQDCIAVEDSIFGIKAAKAAQMKCIAVPSGAHTKEELQNEKPDLLVDSLVEKDKILGFVFKNIRSSN
ncbi:MAG: HAD family hydrolase [Candidatus Bathyarchaeia archaeon]